MNIQYSDALIIGGGLAGLRAAIEVAKRSKCNTFKYLSS